MDFFKRDSNKKQRRKNISKRVSWLTYIFFKAFAGCITCLEASKSLGLLKDKVPT